MNETGQICSWTPIFVSADPVSCPYAQKWQKMTKNDKKWQKMTKMTKKSWFCHFCESLMKKCMDLDDFDHKSVDPITI